MCLRKISYCPICRCYSPVPSLGTPTGPNKTVRIVYEVHCGSFHCFRNQEVYFYLGRTFLPGADLNKTCGSAFCKLESCRYDEIYYPCCISPGLASTFVYRLDSN